MVTADPGSPTFEGFEGVNIEGLQLACPFSAYPAIVDLFREEFFLGVLLTQLWIC